MGVNKRVAAIQPNAIRAFDDQTSDVEDILKLTLGEPDFSVPQHVKQAAIDSISSDDSHYAPSKGSVALRKAIRHFMIDRYDLSYDAETEIVVTLGATEGIYDTLTAFINDGDKVLLPAPNFSMYDQTIALAGGDVVYVDTSKSDFLLTPEQLQAAVDQYGDQLTTVLLNYPSNPTGVTYTAEQLAALADILRGTDITVIADEIYSELTYDVEHYSIAKLLPEQTVILNGVSKSHAMTGYRIGFIVGPAELIAPAATLHQFTVTSASNPAMAAAAEALGSAQGKLDSKRMRDAYRERRDYLVPALRQLGFEIPQPNGAFYVFAKLPANVDQDDYAFGIDLAKRGKVAVIPGSIFNIGGEGYIRISYAASMETLHEAVKRIGTFLANY
ncbi:aminotransferase class I/II-fold pyridoxal phosphate-dependent enzyme [Weissella bombi]|uniref:Aminotransferase n=1 Tax=Weissella bombi TaxID=1505725 RepID=A0A1C3ZNW7_9LACO|nr:aminotransferase class I/II-fold pyridoxal phosphate-dependent enzyme [Weissella bombi]SCB84011.1 aminotransferase [Weissella bombi]